MKNGLGKILVFCCVLAVFTSFIPSGNTVENGVNVLITTDFGKIKIRLYDETPLHRDNFLKLVEKKFFDSLMFHRVIQNFMIQGGDPDSRNAKDGAMLGNGGTGYTLPAEINPKLFHKKGALAAARLSDDINPKKESSGCQFYIVQGKVFSTSEIDQLETSINKQLTFQSLIEKPENAGLKQKLLTYQNQNMMDSLQYFSQQVLEPLIMKELEKTGNIYTFSEAQRKAYTTIGGAPHLDGNYTVFGEVTEGFEVFDKIAGVQVDMNKRPLQNVRMKIELLK